MLHNLADIYCMLSTCQEIPCAPRSWRGSGTTNVSRVLVSCLAEAIGLYYHLLDYETWYDMEISMYFYV